MKKLVILGAGGFAMEVVWLIADINRKAHCWNIIGYVEHSSEQVGQCLNGIRIISMQEAMTHLDDCYAVAAIGDPKTREWAVKEAEGLGFKFPTLVHPSVMMDPKSVEIAPGAIICAGNIFTVNIVIGRHVIVNLSCTIGHNCVIEDFVTISPGCHLSGYTRIGRSAYLGTGAVSIERHEIGPGAVIGAGAVILSDIPPGVTAVGVPAKPIKR